MLNCFCTEIETHCVLGEGGGRVGQIGSCHLGKDMHTVHAALLHTANEGCILCNLCHKLHNYIKPCLLLIGSQSQKQNLFMPPANWAFKFKRYTGERLSHKLITFFRFNKIHICLKRFLQQNFKKALNYA